MLLVSVQVHERYVMRLKRQLQFEERKQANQRRVIYNCVWYCFLGWKDWIFVDLEMVLSHSSAAVKVLAFLVCLWTGFMLIIHTFFFFTFACVQWLISFCFIFLCFSKFSLPCVKTLFLSSQVLTDSESVRWLNHAVEKIWPICMEQIASEKILGPIIPWFLDKYRPWTAVCIRFY